MLYIIGMVLVVIAALVGVFTNKLITAGAVVVGIVFTLLASVVIIPTGQFAVATLFGSIQPGYYAGGGGISLVNPLVSLTYISSQRTPFEVDAKLVSADQNPLTVSGQFPYSPNPAYMYLVLGKIGADYQATLIQRSAQSAFRDGVSSFGWINSVLLTNPDDKKGGRAAVEKAISASWRTAVAQQLVTAGFTPDQAQQAFFYYDVQLNTAEPDQRVKDAIASKVAAQQELERQQTITDTAAKIAERRKNEGAGYGNMLTAIPQLKGQSITAEGVADVLRAIAAYDTASALGAAVEGGKLNSVVFSSAPTTTPNK